MQAERLVNVNFSPVRQVLTKATGMERGGNKIFHLEIGEPDFPTPSSIITKTKEALDQGYTHYAPNRGDKELLALLARKFAKKNAVEYDPDTEIIITVGAAEAIFDSIMALINPGDEVIIFEPAFFNYQYCVRIAAAVPVVVPLRAEDNFQMNEDLLRSAITAKTRMIIINTPHNPTGTVLTKESLEGVARVAREFNLLVLSDEIYEEIIYDDCVHYSIASIAGMKERTIVVNGFSKVYAMTGWRIGYICTSVSLMPAILKIHQYTTTCLATFIQKGLVAGIEDAAGDVTKMIAEFDRRRQYLIKTIDATAGLSCVKPQGAFYVFMNISATGLSDSEFANNLLETAGVALVPGGAFGRAGAGFVRISYATAYQNIVAAMERIQQFVSK